MLKMSYPKELALEASEAHEMKQETSREVRITHIDQWSMKCLRKSA